MSIHAVTPCCTGKLTVAGGGGGDLRGSKEPPFLKNYGPCIQGQLRAMA